MLSQNQQGGCNVIATSSVVVDVTLLLQIKSVISTPLPLSHHHTHIFPAHILPASLVSAFHILNTSTSAPPEHSFHQDFFLIVYQLIQFLYTFLQSFSFFFQLHLFFHELFLIHLSFVIFLIVLTVLKLYLLLTFSQSVLSSS